MEDIAPGVTSRSAPCIGCFRTNPRVFGAIVDDHRQSMLALPGDYDDLPLEEALGRIFLVDIDEETHRKRIEVMRMVIVERRQFPELAALLHQRGGDKSHAMLTEWLEAQARRGRIEIEDAGTTAKILDGYDLRRDRAEADKVVPNGRAATIGAPFCAARSAFSSTASVNADLAARRHAADVKEIAGGALPITNSPMPSAWSSHVRTRSSPSHDLG